MTVVDKALPALQKAMQNARKLGIPDAWKQRPILLAIGKRPIELEDLQAPLYSRTDVGHRGDVVAKHDGQGAANEVEGILVLAFTRDFLALTDLLQDAIGQASAGLHIVVDEQQLADQPADSEGA